MTQKYKLYNIYIYIYIYIYIMEDAVLGRTTKEKGIGVTFSADMKVSEQCGIAASRGNAIIGLIKRNITYKDKQLILPLYNAIVRPHLEYCMHVWRQVDKEAIGLSRVQQFSHLCVARPYQISVNSIFKHIHRLYGKKDINKLERIQRRATKIIPELRNVSYESHLSESGLTTLETRRLRRYQI